MHEVTKAMMFVYRVHKNEPQFFVRYDEQFDHYVVLTGHVEPGETLEETAVRETKEELNAEILSVKDLEYSRTATLAYHMKISHEHAFLVQVPDQDYKFLEGKDIHEWVTLDKLSDVLTYDGQKGAIVNIKKILNDQLPIIKQL